ncbi:uncharacterized protein PG986_015050 [Apiospora aurea]|uniref:Uncharacterized protein n=1 Tax=Apiospora aurea TaxID=335848 RepID=A0ABR1PRG3_9PEZI
MPSEPDSTNPFVRFKHRVDDQISQTVRNIWSSPSSSSNKPQDEAGGSHAWRDTWPTTSNSDDNINGALTNAVDKSANNASPNSQEMATLESAISQSLRDETVKSWVQYSSYSPLHLQYTLPAPLPKDVLSSGGYHREGQFTFRDAFEDLLAVSSDQPLADPAELALRTETPKRLVPGTSEDLRTDGDMQLFAQSPFNVWADRMLPWDEWASGLDRRGRLWDAYFPPASFRPAARRIATVATSDLFRRELTATQAEGFIRKYIGDAAACEEERAWRRVRMLLGSPTLQGLFGQLRGLGGPSSLTSPFPFFGQLLDEDDSFPDLLAQSLVSGTREALDSAFGKNREWEVVKRPGRDADTDEDLYRNVESDYARNNNSRKPRSGLLGLPPPPPMDDTPAVGTRDVTTTQKGEAAGGDNNTKPNENAHWTEEFPEPDGGKTVRSVTRKVGPLMTHETVRTTRYNAQGVAVQTTTQSQHAASKAFNWSWGSGAEDHEGADNDEGGKKKSSSGWFWTK